MNEDEDLVITIKILNKNTNLLANANLSLDTKIFGWITIKGFQIWKSNVFNSRLQESVNIQPPSIPTKGRRFVLIFFENLKKWESIESRIYEEFNLKRNQNSKIESVDLEEIDSKY